MTEMSPEAAKAVELIQKLLNLANKNTNEAEAASAMQRAQKLMEDYNLDLSKVERASGDTGKREKAANEGGLYHWQRDLWRAVAELNFCVYWTATEVVKRKKTDRWGYVYERRGYKFVHMLVGRTVNVTSTRVMAQYLEQTIERLTRERVGSPSEYFTNWALSYREGMAERVMEKVGERRREILSEERRKQREAAEAAAKAGMAGTSTATALVLGDYIQREADANADFMYGEGYSAKKRAREAERAERLRREQAAYTKWAAENPEEARKEQEKIEKGAARSRGSGRTSYDRKLDQRDWSAFSAGHKAGNDVSIDQQAGRTKTAGLLK